MPLKQITFSKKYPYAQFLNYDIGYVWDMEEGDKREDIEAMLLKFADDTHKKNYPHLYQEQTNYVPDTNVGNISQQHEPQPIITKKLSQQELIESEIQRADTPQKLKEWELLSKKYPETKELYDLKYSQLEALQ